MDKLDALEKRLVRVEARLVQLMLHFNLDPYTQTYPAQAPTQVHVKRRRKREDA